MRIAPLVLALELKFHNRKESNFKGNVAKFRAQLFYHDHLQVVMNKVTRPDTRPIPVADGWAGAEMRVFTLSNSIAMTDGRTDKGSYKVACPQLKTWRNLLLSN